MDDIKESEIIKIEPEYEKDPTGYLYVIALVFYILLLITIIISTG